MENTYGISVDNRYELFYIDDDATDPLEAFAVKKKQQQQQQQNNKTTTIKAPATDTAANRKGSAEKENKSAAINKVNQHQNTTTTARDAVKASAHHPDSANTIEKHQAQQQTRDEKGINRRKEAIEKKNRRNREQMDQQQQSATIMQNGVGSGGPGGNAGEEKQRRRRFEGGRGKREFDRKSGSDKTGVKAVDKREGGGSHNWGSHKQDAIDEMMPKKTARNSNEGEIRAENSSDDAAPNESLEQTPPNPVEEETKELTLDEYKALRAGRSKPPQYNLRKAGEGEDISQWKKMVALEAKRPDGQDDGDNDATSYQQRATRQKHILDIEFHFNDGRRSGQFGRGPRSGRPRVSGGPGGAPGTGGGTGGAPGGGGVRGPPRNRRNDGDREHRERPRNMDHHRAHYHHHDDHAAAPKVDDEKAFPQLGLMNSSTVRHPVKMGGPAAAAAAAPKLAQIYNKDDVSK